MVVWHSRSNIKSKCKKGRCPGFAVPLRLEKCNGDILNCGLITATEMNLLSPPVII